MKKVKKSRNYVQFKKKIINRSRCFKHTTYQIRKRKEIEQIKQKVKKSRSEVEFKIKITSRKKCFKHVPSKRKERKKIEEKIEQIKQEVKKSTAAYYSNL